MAEDHGTITRSTVVTDDEVTAALVDDRGVQKFSDSFRALFDDVEARGDALAATR